jgi:hypothetical protein
MDYLVMDIGHTLKIRAFFAEGDPCSVILKTRFIKKKAPEIEFRSFWIYWNRGVSVPEKRCCQSS